MENENERWPDSTQKTEKKINKSLSTILYLGIVLLIIRTLFTILRTLLQSKVKVDLKTAGEIQIYTKRSLKKNVPDEGEKNEKPTQWKSVQVTKSLFVIENV